MNLEKKLRQEFFYWNWKLFIRWLLFLLRSPLQSFSREKRKLFDYSKIKSNYFREEKYNTSLFEFCMLLRVCLLAKKSLVIIKFCFTHQFSCTALLEVGDEDALADFGVFTLNDHDAQPGGALRKTHPLIRKRVRSSAYAALSHSTACTWQTFLSLARKSPAPLALPAESLAARADGWLWKRKFLSLVPDLSHYRAR